METDNVGQFFQFVNERQNVFIRRFDLGLSPPWTKDQAIANFHYTNTYRELDRGTLFFIKYIADKNVAPLDSVFGQYGYLKLFSTLIYRIFNRIETYSAITQDLIVEGNGWNKDTVLKTIKKMEDAGMKVFTPAFMVTGSDHPETNWKAEKKVLDLDEIWMGFEETWKKVKYSTSLKGVWEIIRSLPGFGDFMAYEVACDLMLAKIIPFTEDDFVNIGPGAKKGLREIWPNLEENEMAKEISFLRNNQRDYLDKLGFRYLNGKELTLRNVEHCACEYSKYRRAQRGEHMKRRWKGPTPDDGWYRAALYELYGIGLKPKGLLSQQSLLTGSS